MYYKFRHAVRTHETENVEMLANNAKENVNISFDFMLICVKKQKKNRVTPFLNSSLFALAIVLLNR